MAPTQQIQNNEKRLISAACVLSLVTPVVCWMLAIGIGGLPIWIPFVSDLHLFEPAKTLFPLGMTITALMFVMVIPGLHRSLKAYTKENGFGKDFFPALFSTFLFFAAFSSVIASHVTWSVAPRIHYFAATGLFLFMICGIALFEYVRSMGDLQKVNRLRFVTIVIGGILLLVLGVLSLNLNVLPQDIRYGDLANRPWTMTMAALVEWILVVDLALMMLSMRSEFDSTQ